MSIAIKDTSLEQLRNKFFSDEVRQAKSRELDEKRMQQLPALKELTMEFIQNRRNLKDFRDQLQSLLANDELWGARGPGFMMELNKLRKNHDELRPFAENELRAVLTGINMDNLGERIERFYNFLQNEKNRLQHAGKSFNQAMSPGNAAFMLSLFTFWLNPQHPPVIYYFRTALSIYLLISAGLLPDPGGLSLTYDVNFKTKNIVVRNEKEHRSFQKAIQALIQSSTFFQYAPSLAVEHFLYWLIDDLKEKNEPATTLIQEIADPGLIKPATDGPMLRERPNPYALPHEQVTEQIQPATVFFPNERLKATPEPLLSQLIAEVQSHILIDEQVVRRIYHALLAGHVILTGPPGTGKTELARIIPEILWKSTASSDGLALDSSEIPELTTTTAYTAHLVTATDEWSVRTLISGIAPQSKNGTVTYSVQYGHLTNAIRKNWATQSDDPQEWRMALQRTPVKAPSKVENNSLREFRGQWLVIDEFNRAPIDLALGDALTALGGNDVLRVAIEGGSAELPIPQDFRIIGTLNSFDRNYLNQISEALKRRFVFVEILPPSRMQREAEQGIVLYKALKRISHLSEAIDAQNTLYWGDIGIEPDENGRYTISWLEEQTPFRATFETAWRLFEIIRIYRQLGTAQAITFLQHMLIAGILQGYTTPEDWITKAVDVALCDTLADQLQVLLPDEIDALLLYLTTDHTAFHERFHELLASLVSTPHRLYGQLLALGSVSTGGGKPFLSDEEIEQIAKQDRPEVPAHKLTEIFHLEHPVDRLPQFTRRLRAYKAERGL
ncbi:MAG TPA: AAA family ATPase [Ktedonobacteraceae bacterium]|nr:AAA family ATPase [Ktedonobacteraceae bacterium]